LNPATPQNPEQWTRLDQINPTSLCAPCAIGFDNPRTDELSVWEDGDGEGVVDFDEEDNNRFTDFEAWAHYQLDKTKADSGGAPADDKAELDWYYHWQP
jgi:hypothetical protein